MSVKFSNNGHSTLAASLTNSATSITVASGHGARFPSLTGSEYFYATLIDSSNNLEIVKVTARSSDVLTVTRAQESTTARAYAIGDRVELRVTAQGLVDVGTPGADSIINSMMADDAIDTAQIADDAITAALIADNAVGAAALNVSGNGTSGQALTSDGDGTFSWASSNSVVASSYPSSSLAAGYEKNVNGLIIQWGAFGTLGAATSGSVSFPLTFPSYVYSVVIALSNNNNNGDTALVINRDPSTSGFSWWQNNNGQTSRLGHYIAIGK